MSFVTRCTSCGTLFKVVADQLKISDGWVRCGQCGNVFDAQANLVDPTANAPAAAPPTSVPLSAPAVKPAETEPAAPTAPASVSVEHLTEPQSESAMDSQSFRPGLLRDSAQMDSDAGPSTSTWVHSDSAIASLDAAHPNGRGPMAEPSELGSAEPTTAPTATLPQETPGFVRQAQRAQRWRSPWVRLGLGVLSLILLAGLAAQIVYFEKDRLAAQWPQHKPWLEAFCQQLGCQVKPLQRIESIAVDASSFNRINKNNPQLESAAHSYRLAVTLKNTGDLTVALPHVELSLQDAQDQVVLRKVLSPSDLGINATAFAPSRDASGAVTLQISTQQLPASRVQGYRVFAFYP
jgi:predicted Zn finger-like uncharacterized protein